MRSAGHGNWRISGTLLHKAACMLALLAVLALLSSMAFAQTESGQDGTKIPAGLQKTIEYNNQYASDFALKISFFIAFAAGMLALLSPCILPLLPAYFSYTFKEKSNITKMTLVFFAGFAIVFVAMGMIAGFIGERSLVMLQKGWLVALAGIFFVIMGLMAFFGKGFSSFIRFDHKFRNDVPGVFLAGIFFAIGWTACLGPILSGILAIGAILHNVFYAAVLMLFYSLGNFVPLFVLSVLYDRTGLSRSSLIRGRMYDVKVFGREVHLHTTGMISGALFIAIGLFLLVYRGTAIVNTLDIFGTKSYFYSVQGSLLGWDYANAVGIILFALFVVMVGFVLLRGRQKRKI